MTATLATDGGDPRITISGTGNTTASIHSDVNPSPPANDAYAKVLLNDAQIIIYEFNVRFIINSAAEWTDNNVIIIHNHDASSDAFTFGSSTALVEWGYLNDTDPTAPFTTLQGTSSTSRSPCIYSFRSNNSSQTWTSGSAGIFRMYGGMMRFLDTAADFRNESYSAEFPQSTSLIQVNIEQFGGVEFSGTDYRVQETNFKTTENDGFKMSGATTDKLWDIQFHECDIALDISGSSDNEMRRVELRGNTADLRCSSFSGELTVLDSDTISSISGTASFSGGGFILEANTYAPKCVQTDGETGESGVRVFCYQKSYDGLVAYGSEQVTDSNGEVTNDYTLKRVQLDTDHSTIVGKLDYGNAAIRLREYGKKFMDIEKVLGETGLTDTFIINTNSFVVADYSTASGYTGIAINQVTTADTVSLAFNNANPDTITRTTGSFVTDGWQAGMRVKVIGSTSNDGSYLIDSVAALTITLDASETLTAESAGTGQTLVGGELQITSSHTMQEVYDYLQYLQAESGEMDIPQILKTNDGVSYTMPVNWVIDGIGYLNLAGRYMIGRYVPITINQIVSGTECAIVYNDSTIAIGTSTTTSITLCTPYTASATIIVRARKAGYDAYETAITVSPTGNTVTANLQVDLEYNL